MFGIGGPEVVVLLLLGIVGYGIVMTVDAIRRPASKYRWGPKAAWVTALVALNPFLLRFFGALVWVVGMIIFPVVAVAHHLINRRQPRTPPDRLPP